MTSLNDSVEYLQKIFASELEKKNVRIAYDLDRNRGLHLLVEPVSFKNQVMGNIISNAIKFSHPGGQIEINSYPMNHHYHVVEIRDHGIGMPQALIEHMFDLSKKTSRPGTGGEIGTGFGMHIMKSFMEMYQGQVLIESIEGKDENKCGTTFRLILKGQKTA
jgi:signal transduction histidine kinase